MIEKRIANELGLSVDSIRRTLALLDDGNTVPFIARYRKEMTGNLDEVQIRQIDKVAGGLRQLEERRTTIIKSIEEQGKLSPELRRKIALVDDLVALEDLYAPYRPKRQTRATKAIDAGLAPVAQALKHGENIRAMAAQYVSELFPDIDAVVGGAKDILAEEISDRAEIRDKVRRIMRQRGLLTCKRRRNGDEDPKFEMYFDFTVPVDRSKPHQVLAIRRGEREKVLSAGIEVNREDIYQSILKTIPESAHARTRRWVEEAVEDGYKRLLHPSIERDIRSEIEAVADEHAINVFAVNLKNLLLQAPLPGQTVLGIDPGFRTGCKMTVVDDSGQLVATEHIYVHDGRRMQAPQTLQRMIKTYDVDVIAIGNGTASRETEEVVASAVKQVDKKVRYAIVDEAGASVYSASDIAREEFPDLDVSFRGAVSIARRLQDPLAELVKIDPKSIGVGMYQHDVNQLELQRTLDGVVEDVVNTVGVDLNSASQPLLARVAGIGPVLAQRIVAYRNEHRHFASRSDISKVKGLGAKTFEQCAGFLRIRDGQEALDNTGIHPENYPFARAIIAAIGTSIGDASLAEGVKRLQRDGRLSQMAKQYGVGELTMNDVVDGLLRPGRDPREHLDTPQLRSDVLSMDDLKEGMRLKGTIRNVVDFGAFVDIGVKQDGLVHISQMADKFVKNPYDIVSVGESVDVVITSIDRDRGRIGLSMK